MLVTPLQLADGYAAFANGGTLYQPAAGRRACTQSSAGLPAGQLGSRSSHAIDPQVQRTTGLDARGPRARSSPGSHGVVDNEDGTAFGAFRDYEGVPVDRQDRHRASARPKQDTSWFAAITNPDNDPALPQYVVVAMVEQGGFGANVAAPIVRRVIDFLNNPTATARRS